MADRFDKFSERARRVLTHAQEEAQRFNHNYIGTEHLLLALMREDTGIAVKTLLALAVNPAAVRAEVESRILRGDVGVSGEIGLTPQAKKVIELAVEEARRLNHSYIGTEHLLLGLLREGESLAAEIVKSMEVSTDRVRTTVVRILNSEPARSIGAHGQAPRGEFGTVPGVTGFATLRTAPNAELRDTAVGMLRDAQSLLDAILVEGLAKALIEVLVKPAVTRLMDLMDLQTFNRQEFEDGNTRIKQSLDVLNAATEALQPFDSMASTALMTASAAVQRALAR